MFINMALGGVQEPQPVASGRYDLVISEYKVNPAKPGEGKGANIEVSIGIQGHDTAPNIRHYLSIPKPDDDQQKVYFKQLMIKRFLTQFNISHNDDGFNPEDFLGAWANAQVDLSEPDEQNRIYNRLVLDRLPSEGQGVQQ